MPLRIPVRATRVPAGDGTWQWEQEEETLTIPAVVDPEDEATPDQGEKAVAAGAAQAARLGPETGRTAAWDGQDVAFSPLRPSAGRPGRPGGDAQAEEGVMRSEHAAQVLAVTGARGGLGASVLLLHLAWALGRAGRRVAMMDLDPTGGLDLLCGQSVLTGLRWADLPAEESAFRPGHLVGALPVWHAMPVLTGDVRGGPLPCAEAVLEAMRAEHDVVLVDLPRGASPPPGAGVLIVTGLDLRSAVAAESIVSRLRGTVPAAVVAADAEASAAVVAAAEVPVWLVARQVGEDVVVEDLELITGCPVLGQVPTDRVLAKRLALGEDPVRARSAIRRAASALAQELLSRLPGAAASGPARGGAGPASGPAGAVAGQGDQEAGSQSTNRPTNQPTNQPMNQPKNQQKNQSRSQSWSR